jgi:hypothetical protein
MVAFCLLQLLNSELRQKGLDRIREGNYMAIVCHQGVPQAPDSIIHCQFW